MEIIVVIVIIIAIAIFISDANEKERKREEEAERKRKGEQAIAEYEEKLKNLRETEFFKTVNDKVVALIKDDLICQIEKNGRASPQTIYIETTHVNVSYVKGGVVFNSLGYKNLTQEQIRDFAYAMEVNGFDYRYDEYGNRLYPKSSYWQPIIDGLIAEHNLQFSNPF